METVLDPEIKTPPAPAGLDIRALLKEHEGRNYELQSEHINPANVRTLKTIGFDRCYVRAEGAYLWDIAGTKYLDMLSGYGVFGLGRNHPEVRRVLKEFLDLNYPSLVKMEAPLLSGLLAEQLKKRMPNQLDMVFFTNSGAEGLETAMKYARCATGKPAIIHCAKSFHGLSYGSLSINGDDSFREGFAPFLPDCRKIQRSGGARSRIAQKGRGRVHRRASARQGRKSARAWLLARGRRPVPEIRRTVH
jgi:ornithine--oxo-acid transaminase